MTPEEQAHYLAENLMGWTLYGPYEEEECSAGHDYSVLCGMNNYDCLKGNGYYYYEYTGTPKGKLYVWKPYEEDAEMRLVRDKLAEVGLVVPFIQNLMAKVELTPYTSSPTCEEVFAVLNAPCAIQCQAAVEVVKK
jgi:hypothetical protein